jgi:hypothetical protein
MLKMLFVPELQVFGSIAHPTNTLILLLMMNQECFPSDEKAEVVLSCRHNF